MARLLVLSNGHGEDLSGSLLGQRLQALGHDVKALPLAGLGQAYQRAGIALLGSSHEFTTGGIGYTTEGTTHGTRSRPALYLLRPSPCVHSFIHCSMAMDSGSRPGLVVDRSPHPWLTPSLRGRLRVAMRTALPRVVLGCLAVISHS